MGLVIWVEKGESEFYHSAGAWLGAGRPLSRRVAAATAGHLIQFRNIPNHLARHADCLRIVVPDRNSAFHPDWWQGPKRVVVDFRGRAHEAIIASIPGGFG